MTIASEDMPHPEGATLVGDELSDQLRALKPSSTATLSGRVRQILQTLGPGVVTGASDDDPSGIATYSQVGAQFGYGMLWTMVLSYPLMAAIQEISARVGGLPAVAFPPIFDDVIHDGCFMRAITLVLVANIFNLGADIGAMGAAAQLLLPARTWIYILLFGIASLLLQVFVPYTSYVKYLKWLTLSLFAYVATAFFVRCHGRRCCVRPFCPD